MRLPLLLAALLLALHAAAQGPSLTVGGSWSDTVGAADLQSGAGSGLPSSFESAAGAVELDVTAPGDWRIDVERDDLAWHGDLALSVRRSGSGSGVGTVTGGTSYQQVGTLAGTFLTGSLDLASIPLQYRLDGVSLEVPPGTYTTTVTFTITAN